MTTQPHPTPAAAASHHRQAHSDGAAKPLSGLVVADFSRVLAGPMATMLLADLGATVIKVERPEGDDTRHWGPPWVGGHSSYFEAANRSKLSVVLDLAKADDLAHARELVRRADVLVENFRTATMEKFGLGYDQAARVNPGLIYCSLTGFGSGAGAGIPGYDFIVQAVGGLMSITGSADDQPVKVGVALVDVLTGKDAGDRHPRRSGQPRADRRWTARRGQPVVQPAGVTGEPSHQLPRDQHLHHNGWQPTSIDCPL